MQYIPYIEIQCERISAPGRTLQQSWSVSMTGRILLAEERDVAWEADASELPFGILPPMRDKAPIYYRLPDTPDGHHIKEYASGLRQLVRFVGVEEQVVKFSLG